MTTSSVRTAVSSLIDHNIIKYLSLISTTCYIRTDVVGVQFVPGALFDHPAQQLLELFLLLVTEDTEDPVVGGDRIADHGLGHLASLIREKCLQYPAVLRILFTLDQPAALQLLECQLHPL